MSRDSMLEEMVEQPAVLERILSRTWPVVEALVREQRPERIVLTGSGDSLCAARCGAWALRDMAKGVKDVAAVCPLDLARYRHDLLGPGTWLLAVSASGRTRRVLEAAAVARAVGSRVLAVTDDASGPLAGASDDVLELCASPQEALGRADYQAPEARAYVGYHHDVPQTKTFTASVFVAYATACALSGRSREAGLASLRALPGIVASVLAGCEAPASSASSAVADAETLIFLASGDEVPNAQYGAFKMYEFVRTGLWQEMEEYCHTQYFITRKGTPVIFLAHDALSLERAGEVAPVLKEVLEARCILITTGESTPGFDHVIAVSCEGQRTFRPLIMNLAVQRFAHALARHAGLDTSTFRGGIDAERYVAGSLRTIRGSRIIDVAEVPKPDTASG